MSKIKFPNSITNLKIDLKAFDGCSNLKEIDGSYDMRKKFRKLFQKELKINKKEKLVNYNDYLDYKTLEALEIPLKSQIDNSEKFFSTLSTVKCLCCNPELLKDFKDKTRLKSFIIPEKVTEVKVDQFVGFTNLEVLQIPQTVKIDDERVFRDLNNIHTLKCKFNQLQLFDKKKLKTIIIEENKFTEYITIFEDCVNLENIILPDCCADIKEELFSKCKKLKTIQYLSGSREKFRSKLEIPEETLLIQKSDYEMYENVDDLTLPSSIGHIINGSFDHMNELVTYRGHPKWLKFIPKMKIVEIYIPDYVTEIDKEYFRDCISLKAIHFASKDIKIEGNDCKEFDEITNIECHPELITRLQSMLKQWIRFVKIIDGTETLTSNLFDSFEKLEEVILPNSLKEI